MTDAGVSARAVPIVRTAVMSPDVEAVERSSRDLRNAAHDWGMAALALLLEFSNTSTFFLASASLVLAASPVAIVVLAA